MAPSPVDRARPGSKHTPSSYRCSTRFHRSVACEGAPAANPAACTPTRGYDFDKYRRQLWKRGIKPVIARRGTAHGSGLGKIRW